MGVLCLIIVAALSGCINDKGPEGNVTMNQTPHPLLRMWFFLCGNLRLSMLRSSRRLLIQPYPLKVVNGTTVRWTNKDSATYVINVNGIRSPELNKRDAWSYRLLLTKDKKWGLEISKVSDLISVGIINFRVDL